IFLLHSPILMLVLFSLPTRRSSDLNLDGKLLGRGRVRGVSVAGLRLGVSLVRLGLTAPEDLVRVGVRLRLGFGRRCVPVEDVSIRGRVRVRVTLQHPMSPVRTRIGASRPS